jgi:hypothetical protein
MENSKNNFVMQSNQEPDRLWLDEHRQNRRIRRALSDEAPWSHILVIRSAGVISKFPVYQMGGEA